MSAKQPTFASAGQLAQESQLREILCSMFPHPAGNIVYAFAYGSGVFDQQVVLKNQNDISTIASDSVDDAFPTHPDSHSSPVNMMNHKNIASHKATQLPMLDLILVVNNAHQFHKYNKIQNPSHYSIFGQMLGSSGCAYLQQNFGGRVFFFNTTITSTVVDDNNSDNKSHSKKRKATMRRLKYGVVEINDLESDLDHWDSLYIAGRMQKPILPLNLFDPPRQELPTQQNREESNHDSTNKKAEPMDVTIPPGLSEAQQRNLQSALVTAFCLVLSEYRKDGRRNTHVAPTPMVNDELHLQHPVSRRYYLEDIGSTTSNSLVIPYATLFEQICALSYSGDFRMTIGAEDPRKIQRLVHGPGQLPRFCHLYQRPLDQLEKLGIVKQVFTTSQTCSTSTGGVAIPLDLIKNSHGLHKNFLPEDFWVLLPKQLQHQLGKHDTVSQALKAIVAPAARQQALKGLVTAGVGASFRYAAAKLAKGWKR